MQEWRSRETCKTRAPSVTRVAICVSRILHDGLQKKETARSLSNLWYEVSIKPVTYMYGSSTFVDQQIHVLSPWLFNKLQLVELNSTHLYSC